MSFVGEALGFALEAAFELFTGSGRNRQSTDQDQARPKRSPWREAGREDRRDGE